MTNPADFLKKLDLLCEGVREEWNVVDLDPTAFPDIAHRALAGAHFLDALQDYGFMMSLLNMPSLAVLQAPSNFSDCYVRLYDNGRFWVEVLNWWGSDINIHDHDFAGAQRQIAGSSLNVVYDYSPRGAIGGLDEGELGIKRVEVWQPGSVSRVQPEDREPHNVCHLSNPTISLLLRTHPRHDLKGQQNYFPCGLRGFYLSADLAFQKRVSLLRYLGRKDPKEFYRQMQNAIHGSPTSELFFLLTKLVDLVFKDDLPQRIAAKFGAGRTGDRVVACLAKLRADLFISNAIKTVEALDEPESLVLSAMTTVSTWTQLQEVLERTGRPLRAEPVLVGVLGKLPPHLRTELEIAISLLRSKT